MRRRPRARRCRRRSTRCAERRPLRAHARAGAAHHRARERARCRRSCATSCCAAAKTSTVPVLGITGTGGAGKSSLTDELVRRFRLDQDDGLQIAIVSIDPSRRKSGGALLGDRIRMNAIEHPHIYMRSLATRDAGSEISKALPDAIAACKVGGLRPRRSSRPRASARATPRSCRCVDVSLYVMTPEFGAASQLEKIDMLDFADFVAINKFDRKGAARRAARRAQAVPAQPRALARRARRRCRCSARSRRASTTTASPRSTRRSPRSSREQGLKLAAGHAAARSPTRQSTAQNVIVPAARVALPRRDRRDACAATTAGREAQATHRARAAAAARGEADARDRCDVRAARATRSRRADCAT